MDILDLSGFFTTKPQAIDFSARLATIADNLYESNFNLEEELQKNLGVSKKDKFMTLLRNNEISIGSNSVLADFFTKIRNTISSLETVTLTIALQPDQESLKEIADWFPLNLDRQVLIDIQIDPEIVAGAIIGYKGKRFNASIKKLFEVPSSLSEVQKQQNAKVITQKTQEKH